jgi:hypothetical protein
MNKEDAIQVLEQALNAATMKGVYSLSDVELIIQSMAKVRELIEIVPGE